jgi:H/ACA ribonucleoprotein complex subunit 4
MKTRTEVLHLLQQIKSQKSIQELLNFGIINVDKPSNPTSFDVSDHVRRVMNEIGVKKTSHFGTLDPKVSGVLPIALNRACKLTGFFLGEDKEYVGIMRLHEDVSIEKIEGAIKDKFLGKISQLPPVRSRVKRAEREREIKRFEIIEKNGKDFLFLAEVQGGTYIRKLISDLGDYLGIGAHMLELRRIRAGIFKEEESVNLYDLENAIEDYKKGNEEKLRKIIVPGEIVSEVYSSVEIKNKNLKNIMTGKPIYLEDLKNLGEAKEFEKDDVICVFCNDKFIEIAKVMKENDIFSKPEFVFTSEKV